jgi:microcystin-dependent protein
MASPYIGEIRLFAGNFAPLDWNFCDGSLLSISQYTALYNLIGTTYGGNGQTNFAVPDLRSRVPVHQGTGPGGTYTMGQSGGVETVTLTTSQMPQHTHPLNFANTGQVLAPSSNVIPAVATTGASLGPLGVYGPLPPNTTLNPNTLKNDGGSQPHSNIQPYQALTFIIALFGIYPTQA